MCIIAAEWGNKSRRKCLGAKRKTRPGVDVAESIVWELGKVEKGHKKTKWEN